MEKEAEDYTEEQYLAQVDAVKSMADTAKAYGQKVAFEYHYLTYCNKASSILKLISAVDKDNVFTYWQPAYWINAYWNKGLSEEQRIEYNLEEIKKLGDKIINVHVYSWRGHDRFALSSDSEEWAKYIDALPNVNSYMEFVKDNTLEQFSLDAKTLLSLGKK